MQDELIAWYRVHHRHFPWREDQEPYHIWISEIMLQQTTTETVIPYYQRFMARFPDVNSLALASEEEVYKMWEGLGYYRRARHLHESAKIIVEQYEGKFPHEYEAIRALKGIGDYTAGAISSIAFQQQVPAVDGNVLRIISRVYMIKDNIALSKTQKKIYQIVAHLLTGKDASAFNQGLMDLGATICRPLHPRCFQCPIAKHCQAFEQHQQEVLPVNIKKIRHQEKNYITGIITYQGRLLMIKNKAGLLENLYGFIQYELESPYSFVEKFAEDYHCLLAMGRYIKNIKHVFTHRTWHMHVYHYELESEIEGLFSIEQIQALPVSTAHLKVLKAYLHDMNS